MDWLANDGIIIALITGIGSLITSIGLGIFNFVSKRREVDQNVEQSKVEASPEILRIIKESNQQEFDIMRALNVELRERLAELEAKVAELEEYKRLYEELSDKYDKLVVDYEEIKEHCLDKDVHKGEGDA